MLRYKLISVIALWTVAVCFGLHVLMVYKGKAGPVGAISDTWPANSSLSRSADKPTLLMFAHPKCPCTRATLGELDQLTAKAQGKFEPILLFYMPKDKPGWTNSSLINAARSIPGVRVVFDTNGELARRFGAETSGHVMLYGPDRKLLFSGGITGSRGHLGDNAGLDALVKILNHNFLALNRTTAPVFGCELLEACTSNQTTPAHN